MQVPSKSNSNCPTHTGHACHAKMSNLHCTSNRLRADIWKTEALNSSDCAFFCLDDTLSGVCLPVSVAVSVATLNDSSSKGSNSNAYTLLSSARMNIWGQDICDKYKLLFILEYFSQLLHQRLPMRLEKHNSLGRPPKRHQNSLWQS